MIGNINVSRLKKYYHDIHCNRENTSEIKKFISLNNPQNNIDYY